MAGPTILDESKANLVTQRVSGSPFGGSNILVHLWTGSGHPDHTATRTSLIADDPTFTGYSAQGVGSWSVPGILGADFIARSTGTPVTFTNSSGSASVPITGWWLEDGGGGKALLVGLFPVSFTIPAGAPFTFTPVWEGTGENLTT